MPEHDTYDLEAAFRALEQDISGISAPRGAGAAITSARRRRQTRWSVAAVAVLVVGAGAVFVGQNAGRDHAVGPAYEPPSPAQLTAERLTTATAGWTPAWEANTKAAQRRMQQDVANDDCFPSFSGGVPDGYTVFGNSHDDLGITTTADFTGDPSGEPVVWDQMVGQMKGCAQEISSFSDPSTGVAGYTFQIAATGTESAPTYAWIASTDQGIGVLKILGQSDPLPSSNDTAVTDALVAAVEFRVAHSDPRNNGSVQRIDPAETAGQVWAQALEPALVGWSTPWSPRLPRDASGPLPDLSLPACVGTPEGNDQGNGLTVNVGRDGFEWVHWFSSEAAAVQVVDQLRQALATCSTPYDVHTVTLASGRPVVVAVGPQVLWFTRVASHVLVLQLPAGGTPPSDDVSQKVGDVLEHVLEQPATTTMSPGDTPPRWMQRAIAAAPTFGP